MSDKETKMKKWEQVSINQKTCETNQTLCFREGIRDFQQAHPVVNLFLNVSSTLEAL